MTELPYSFIDNRLMFVLSTIMRDVLTDSVVSCFLDLKEMSEELKESKKLNVQLKEEIDAMRDNATGKELTI